MSKDTDPKPLSLMIPDYLLFPRKGQIMEDKAHLLLYMTPGAKRQKRQEADGGKKPEYIKQTEGERSYCITPQIPDRVLILKRPSVFILASLEMTNYNVLYAKHPQLSAI